MKYCKTCKVSYDTPLKKCILCNGELTTNSDENLTYKFTPYEKIKTKKHHFRWFLFLNLLSIGVSLFIDLTYSNKIDWSLIVAISNVYSILIYSVWYFIGHWAAKLTKTILVTLSFLIFIGLTIGDHLWAIDYVLPLGLSTLTIITTLSLLIGTRKFDHAFNLVFVSLTSLVPGIFNFVKLTTVRWPGIVSFWIGIAALLGLIFFSSKESKTEFFARFHI